MAKAVSYGATRKRAADVSYADIEAAAHAILLTGVRPTVDGIREALKAGSQRTLLSGLQRYWSELGARLSGVPDSRRRLPAAVADLADSIWQQALVIATEAAHGADDAFKAQLAQLRTETEVRGHALAQREIEIDALVASRERTIRELEAHLRSTLALVNKRDVSVRSLESRLAAALRDTQACRERLESLVARRSRNPPNAAVRGKKSPRTPWQPKSASSRKLVVSARSRGGLSAKRARR